MDVHKDQHIYLEDPKPVVPIAKPGKGRKPKKLKAQTKPIRVDEWAEKQPDDRWQRTYVRNTIKGKLLVDILHQRVWLWDGEEPEAHCWHLIVRREVGGNKVKYSLCNAPASTSVRRLAFMQAQRYWIERTFQDAKNQYSGRNYKTAGGPPQAASRRNWMGV